MDRDNARREPMDAAISHIHDMDPGVKNDNA